MKHRQERSKMTKNQAARLGGLARIKKYGNPGTFEGRVKGGRKSVKMQRTNPSNFIVEKKFKKPAESALLAEFMGMMQGDGHLSKYQASITTGTEKDMEHAIYMQSVAQKLFGIKVHLRFKRGCKAVEIVMSSVDLVQWLQMKGMPLGNKMKGGLCIPSWIHRKSDFQKNYIRGLFDTDGCVYIDSHLIAGKKYHNLGWTITSYSAKLRCELVLLLQNLGFRPTLHVSQVSVYMRRKGDIDKYFKEIGSSNPKHLQRYSRILKK